MVDEQGRGRSLSVEQGETTIEITTIHKAKGLEKKVVLIPYCNWTLNPKSSGLSANIVWAEGTDGELEEIGQARRCGIKPAWANRSSRPTITGK